MKNKLLLLLLLLSASLVANAQQLQTMRNYYDFDGTKPREVYTVKQGTGIKHGNYKSYTRDGL